MLANPFRQYLMLVLFGIPLENEFLLEPLNLLGGYYLAHFTAVQVFAWRQTLRRWSAWFGVRALYGAEIAMFLALLFLNCLYRQQPSVQRAMTLNIILLFPLTRLSAWRQFGLRVLAVAVLAFVTRGAFWCLSTVLSSTLIGVHFWFSQMGSGRRWSDLIEGIVMATLACLICRAFGVEYLLLGSVIVSLIWSRLMRVGLEPMLILFLLVLTVPRFSETCDALFMSSLRAAAHWTRAYSK